jgi:hypothetical protein
MELVKDLTLDVLLSSVIGVAMGLVLLYLSSEFASMDWVTLGLLNVFVLLFVHVLVKVMVRYRIVALVTIPLVMVLQFPWVFLLVYQVLQLVLYTWS